MWRVREADLVRGGYGRYAVLVFLLALAALFGAACGGQEESGEETGSGGDSGGQYGEGQYESGGVGNQEGTGSVSSGAVGGGFSEEACLEDAAGSGEAGVEIAEPADVPSYEVTEEAGETGEDFEVVTEAASREELMLVAEDLRYDNQGLDAFSVDFYDAPAGEERQDSGIAFVFNTREAACRDLQYPVEDQDRLISESNGVSVISVEEGV